MSAYPDVIDDRLDQAEVEAYLVSMRADERSKEVLLRALGGITPLPVDGSNGVVEEYEGVRERLTALDAMIAVKRRQSNPKATVQPAAPKKQSAENLTLTEQAKAARLALKTKNR